MNKPTVDRRMVFTCFSVAALTALSVWHAYNFYHARITQRAPNVESVRFDLIPLEASKEAAQSNPASRNQR